jgi:hypothetical protein
MMSDREQQPPREEELLARFVGDARDRDEEDILFWRNASEQLRGATLYRLRARGKAMYHAVPHAIEQQNDAVRLVLRPHSIEIITGYE